MKLGRMGIRKQVLYLVLACSIVTLFVAGGIALIGMMNIKSNAVNIGMEIGTTAAENSSEALKENTKASLAGLVSERAKQVDYVFKDFTWDVNMLAAEMTTILNTPQDYATRYVAPPDRNNTGKIVPQIQYSPSVNPADLRYEVGLTANLQDFMMRLNTSTPLIGSTYVTSKNGFTISVDDVSQARVDANNVPLMMDYTVRPWYQRAVKENKLIFTDVFVDKQGRGLAIACAAPYYNALGEVAGVVGEGRTLANISQIVNETAIGKTGFGFLINNTGQILFSPKLEGSLSLDYDDNLANDPSLFDSDNKALSETAKKMAKGETGMELLNIDGVSYYLAYTPLKDTGWSFAVAIEESEVTLPADTNKQVIENSTGQFVGVLNDSIKMMILAMIAAFVAIIALVPFAGRTLADKFTKPLQVLTDGVREIASGNLDKKLDIHTGNEIEHLAACFNAMTDELQTYMNNLTKATAEKERIATELDVAKNIQTSMLPNDFNFNRTDFTINATMKAAKEVGGDFYDFYLVDDNHLVVTIADVSGKGVPAALFMMMSKTILKNLTLTMTNPDDLGAVVTLTNNQLCANNDAMMFVTVFTGILDLKSGEFTFVNGGHNPPLVYRAKKDAWEYVKVKRNFVLGGMEDVDFVQEKITLDKGDRLYLYTDGVTEALNVKEELYGEERLLDCLNGLGKRAEGKGQSAEEIIKTVKEDVGKHVGDAEQSDDMTMLVVVVGNRE